MKAHISLKLKISAVATFVFLLFTCEIVEAQTPAGVAHHSAASRRRTAVVVSSATKANDQQQAAAEAPPPAEAAPAEAAPAPAQTTTPPPASTEAQLPFGTVVTKLPAGCVSVASGGQQYYQCGANYYAAAYQEGTLMYVTVSPPK